MATVQANRPLTPAEQRLARWMLEHGTSEAATFLPQLELAEVTPWKCPCGCASINFQIQGQPEAPPGVHILGDYLVGEGERMSGAFIFESGGEVDHDHEENRPGSPGVPWLWLCNRAITAEFYGGVVEPALGEQLALEIWPEVLDKDGNLNPPAGSPTVEGALQVSLTGTADAYRELGRYFLAVAELDTTADPGFHEHHELTTSDGRTHLHIIVRKVPSLFS